MAFGTERQILAGTAAEVIPITKLDGRTIGTGNPGPITTKLINAFLRHVEHDAPED